MDLFQYGELEEKGEKFYYTLTLTRTASLEQPNMMPLYTEYFIGPPSNKCDISR